MGTDGLYHFRPSDQVECVIKEGNVSIHILEFLIPPTDLFQSQGQGDDGDASKNDGNDGNGLNTKFNSRHGWGKRYCRF